MHRLAQRPRKLPPPPGERGHTLMELMVASAVFIIGMTAIMFMQSAAIGNNALSADHSLASNLAASGLERLRVDDYNDVVGTSPCPPTSPRDLDCYFDKRGAPLNNPNEAYFTRTWEAVTDSVSQVTDITVKVTWNFSVSGYAVEGNKLVGSRGPRSVELTGRIYPR